MSFSFSVFLTAVFSFPLSAKYDASYSIIALECDRKKTNKKMI